MNGTMDVESYLADVRRRLGADGCEVRDDQVGPLRGIAAFTVLVSYQVADAAKAAAERPATMEFAVRCQPVVVDLGSRTVHTFRGRQLWGLMLNGHLRRKLALYLPEPAAVGTAG